MPQDPQIESLEAAAGRVPADAHDFAADVARLQHSGEELSKLLAWNPSVHTSHFFSVRWNAMSSVLRPTLEKISKKDREESDADDLRWLRDNQYMLWSELWNTRNAFKLHKL